ncbi:hypothetical protein LX95_01305 [Mesonia algae]|uniref:Uncharacterized protein n=1 Tax=Mesonia algae TaxID=213248 RepID=A0A2W7I4L5_9FLAO|nr:hypothetical protein [Mesonia algae]PZW41624.1 hypothetical protein LX95_01305 [Mesonia algae]
MAGPVRNNGSNIQVDSSLSLTSINPVQNKVIAALHLEPAEYEAPTASITNVSQDVENGTTIEEINLQVNFNQNDAGAATGYEIIQDENVIANAAGFTVDSLVVPLGNVEFKALVNYAQGPVKQNNLGEDDPTGQIQAGSIFSQTRIITGTQRSFFGSVASTPTNSAQARALTKIKSSVNSFSFLASEVNNSIIVPQGTTLASVVSSNNETLTGQFTSQAITVNDAAGNPQNYTVFNLQTAQPLAATLNVTLSN